MNHNKNLLLPFKLWRLIYAKIMQTPTRALVKTLKIKCYVCGNEEFAYEEEMPIRESICTKCKARLRNSDVAFAICKLFNLKNSNLKDSINFLRDKCIYEAQSFGSIHEILKFSPHYTCSEYFDNIEPGSIHPILKTRCEDLQKLSFPNESFDLVITQDVFEHIADPKRAFEESIRVLRTNGAHIFTVPLHEGRKTIKRIKILFKKVLYLLPPIYHGDYLREKGSLVFTDFGDDLFTYLGNQKNIESSVIVRRELYNKKNIAWANNIQGYLKYFKARIVCKITNDFRHILKYFKYNSIVFCCLKKEHVH